MDISCSLNRLSYYGHRCCADIPLYTNGESLEITHTVHLITHTVPLITHTVPLITHTVPLRTMNQLK